MSQTVWCHHCEKVMPISFLTRPHGWRPRPAKNAAHIKAHLECGHAQTVVMTAANIQQVVDQYRSDP